MTDCGRGDARAKRVKNWIVLFLPVLPIVKSIFAKEVMWYSAFVCLFVCSQRHEKTADRIFVKISPEGFPARSLDKKYVIKFWNYPPLNPVLGIFVEFFDNARFGIYISFHSHSADGATKYSATTILRVTWMRASVRNSRDCQIFHNFNLAEVCAFQVL